MPPAADRVTFRPASLADSAAIARLEADLFAAPWPLAAVESFWADASPVAWIAVDAQHVPIAYLLFRTVPVAGEAELLRVATVPEWRRQGIAHALLERALAELDERRLDCFLEVHAANLPAQELYAGLGFVAAGLRRGYYPDGGDARLFARSFHSSAG